MSGSRLAVGSSRRRISGLFIKDFASEIKRIYTFNRPLDEENSKIAQDIITNKSVSLHIRRGDFLLKRNHKHQVDLTKYYSDAIKSVLKNYNSPKFYIFTDDFDWVSSQKIFNIAENIYAQTSKTSLPNEQDDFNETIETFASMLNYQHYIVGNSSFSFWAAFLSATESSVVTVPDPWFRNNEHPVLRKENWFTVSNF